MLSLVSVVVSVLCPCCVRVGRLLLVLAIKCHARFFLFLLSRLQGVAGERQGGPRGGDQADHERAPL